MQRLSILALCCASALAQPPTPAITTGAIHGLATEERTGLPLPSILVRINPLVGGKPQSTIQPDKSGRFRFPDLPPGRYAIILARTTFQSFTRVGRLPSRCVVSVKAGEDAECNLTLPGPATVTGKVTDEAGNPIAKAKVSVGGATEPAMPLQAVGSAITDTEGVYRITSLSPGRYQVVVLGPAANHRPAWFPGVPTAKDASLIILRAGDEIGGINFTLKDSPIFQLDVDASALVKAVGPAASVSISLREGETPGWRIYKASPNGTVSIPKLFKGRYEVLAEAGLPGGTATFSAMADTNVGAEEVTHIKLLPEPQFDLVGNVVGEKGTQILNAGDADTRIWIRAVAGMTAFTFRAAPLSEATFRVRGLLAASYQLRVENLRPGYFVTSMSVGSLPIGPGNVATLRPGDTLTIRVSDQGATLTSRTITPDGKPFSGGYTVLVDPDSLRSAVTPNARGAENSESGTAVFQSLKPGAYIALAFDSFDLTLLNDPETLRKYLPYGTKVELSAKESKLQDLPLTHFED